MLEFNTCFQLGLAGASGGSLALCAGEGGCVYAEQETLLAGPCSAQNPAQAVCGTQRCLKNSMHTGITSRRDHRSTRWGFMAGGKDVCTSLCSS
ncbi:hypothetical protein NDU88_006934 [Pleurodeles waltl]|uniref:Secreted protein n=1 Tax=Pleurodeles waltl TaxID=8319 RepID=A0AAV7PJS9_PLEWA|nr:hypothetical protein NDU88_006934 [Pleurodeles waltl]